jgi:hypothetical protein
VVQGAAAVLAISTDPARRTQALDVLLGQTDKRALAETVKRLREILSDPRERERLYRHSSTW